ncbi:MAG: hypothetical protein ACRD0P_40170, partial [Stackebrandtia sp.]
DCGLTVRLTGARRAFGRWRPLTIPWRHVTGVRPGSDVAGRYPGMRWGVSTHIPGVITIGSFRRNGSREFWDVADPDRTIVVELGGEKYHRLVLEVDDPVHAITDIDERAAAARARGADTGKMA